MSEKTILVVDDASILNMFELAFSQKGYTVKTAASAEETLALVEREKIHVMFLGLNLPEVNGIDLCRAIKKQMPTVILYALTGDASLFELSECREAGFDDYFKKPVSMTRLLAAVEAAFEKLERWKNG